MTKQKEQLIREIIKYFPYAMIGTLEQDFVLALTEMMDGQLANTQMVKQRSPHLFENSWPQVFRFIFKLVDDSYGIL